MTDKIKIGLKYCGGCNPRYDRIQVTDHLKKTLAKWAVFVSFEAPGISRILIIAGCETACVDRSPFGSIPVDIITSPDDARDFIHRFGRNYR